VVSDERMALELHGTLDRTDFPGIGESHKGKVRDSYIATTPGDARSPGSRSRMA